MEDRGGGLRRQEDSSVPLARGRLSQPDQELTHMEEAALRSLIYKIAWVGKEARPEAAGAASLLASRLKDAKIEDVAVANRMVKFLRSTASQSITLWRHDLDTVVAMVAADCGGVGSASGGGAQGAWVLGIADSGLAEDREARVSVLSWRSTRLKRVVPSTIAGEAQAFSQGLAEAEWVRVWLRD
eukprot:450774-Lingulodinium_polyedra.AAC.1